MNMMNQDINLSDALPEDETSRQYYYIEKARLYVQELSSRIGRPLTFCVTTFGCQMNARDSEKLRGILREIGYLEAEEDQADFVIYNTCTVRENANTRVYGRLGQLKPRKKKNPHMMIGLCGCMMQEPEVIEKLKKSYPFVDIIFGTHNIFKFAELIAERFATDKPVIDIWEGTDQIVENLPNQRKYAFKSGVNIMFGCNNFCSYCIVPYVRGRERSREPQAILDEIGRGTSTFDGMSIARAVLEYVCKKKTLGAKALFATHYHELTAMEGMLDGVKNYSIAVKKRGDDITFLRRIVRGGADESFGIEVAKLAGVPDSVVRRAKAILKELEKNKVSIEFKAEDAVVEEEEEIQYNFAANGKNEILEILKATDVNTLTPIEAMQTLYDLKKKAEELS